MERQSWRLVAALILVCWTGCDGGDGDPDAAGGLLDGGGDTDAAPELTCDGNGAGQADGTVGGTALDPVRMARFQVDPTLDERFSHLLILSETSPPDGCPPFDGPQGDGDALYVRICHPPEAGTYEVVELEAYPLPDPDDSCDRLAVASFNTLDGPGAVAGSITIESVGPHAVGCVVGHFSVVFGGGDELEGTFEALRCESK
jgi:hypothetical protein